MSWRCACLAFVLLALSGRARAQDDFLGRLKAHEQELEKKIKTEAEAPNKKERANKLLDHVGENSKETGRQAHDAVTGGKRAEKPARRRSDAATSKKAEPSASSAVKSGEGKVKPRGAKAGAPGPAKPAAKKQATEPAAPSSSAR